MIDGLYRKRISNISVKEDSKGDSYMITKEDSEGFHTTIFLTKKELRSLINMIRIFE